jgi:hypothetical protein
VYSCDSNIQWTTDLGNAFTVGHDGVLYEKDFGPRPLDVLKSMGRYNPDKTREPVKEQKSARPSESGSPSGSRSVSTGSGPLS